MIFFLLVEESKFNILFKEMEFTYLYQYSSSYVA